MATPSSAPFNKWSCRDLTNFLKARDIKTSNYRKAKLVDLAEKAQALDLALVDEEDENERLVEFFSVTLSGEERTLDRSPPYASDLREMPHFTFGDVFAYCLGTCQWSQDRLRAYKNDDSFRLYSSKHILNVQLCKISTDSHHSLLPSTVIMIRSDCVPETRQNEKPYVPELIVDDTAAVIKGRCTCPAGNGTCKHVLALLFALENFNARRTDGHTAVGTDGPCQWNQPRVTSHPARIADMNFSCTGQPTKLTKLDYQPGPTPDFATLTEDWVKALAGSSAVARQILDSADEPPGLLPDLTTLIVQSRSQDMDFDSFMEPVLAGPLPQQVESATRGQANNREWKRQKLGRITGSYVHGAAHYKGDEIDNYIARGVLGKSTHFTNIHLEYGQITEVVARQLYYDMAKKSHKKLSVVDCGLFLCKVDWRFAVSPDGIISCSCCGKGVLEIKCPSVNRDSCVTDLAALESHRFAADENGNPKLKLSTNYYSQVQMQLYVCDGQYCDFVVYTKPSGVHVERIYPDYQWRRSVLSKARLFYDAFIEPQLYSDLP